jgi:tetratricopeptide (TPR) repeat protein
MAYFDLGKYEEAEKWFNRARTVDKTKTASEYNLGRIAFETGRYEEAARHFENILVRDPSNITALKAAAYTRIKTGDYGKAEELYGRVLLLVPESADDGYNYALVLYAVKKYEKAAEVLGAYSFALEENNELLLLYARSLGALGRIEAADYYAKWLGNSSDSLVSYEYARVLEQGELYAKALEQYQQALTTLPADNTEPGKAGLHFTIARLLLIADSEGGKGLEELRAAVNEGFADTELMTALLSDKKIRNADKEEIQKIITEMGEKARKEAEAIEAGASETDLQTDTGDGNK